MFDKFSKSQKLTKIELAQTELGSCATVQKAGATGNNLPGTPSSTMVFFSTALAFLTCVEVEAVKTSKKQEKMMIRDSSC